MSSRFDAARSRVDATVGAVTRLTGLPPVVVGVAVVTVLSLSLRLAALGNRVAHFDEGRVAYWIVRYAETGEFHYRYIIHGPLVQHVNRLVFQTVGRSDVTMRAVTATFGGLLPASVLLVRRRLRPVETVLAAAFLAVNPVLVYYSRFFRSSILVAGLMLVSLFCLVRAFDDGRPVFLHGAAVAAALGFGAKENAVVYLLCYAGAGALLLDYHLLNPPTAATGTDVVRDRLARLRATVTGSTGRRRVGYWTGHAAAAAGLVGLVTLFLFAPRDPNGLGLWSSLADPSRLPTLVDTTVADIRRGMEYWFGHSASTKCNKDNLIAGYVCFLERTLGVLWRFALPLVGAAVVGFLAERYATARPRPLVMLASYWGFVSVLGYPLGTDIFGAWITVNALVPLAIPAAVGLGVVVRGVGREWGGKRQETTPLRAAVVAFVVVLLIAQTATAVGTGVYTNPTADSNELVQYAQPTDDFRPAIRDLSAVAPATDGTDVLFYGSELVVDGAGGGPIPACTVMVRTLPLHWYVQVAGATGDCARNTTALDEAVAAGPPPVVVVHEDRAGRVADRLPGYESSTYRLRTVGRPVTFFVDPDAVGNATRTDRMPPS